MSDEQTAREELQRRWFDGYTEKVTHPRFASTGSEGRCDLCGSTEDDGPHSKPYGREMMWPSGEMREARKR